MLANFFVLLGGAPAAPVFMLIMGVFLMRSKASTKKNIFRGIKIILLGYLLNLLSFTIPLLVAGENEYIYFAGEMPLDMLFSVDILQLAGLSIILGTLIKKIINNKIAAPLIILTILIISPLLCEYFGDNNLFSILWGKGNTVLFPFFPWFAYPLLGMYLSKYLLDMASIKINLKKLALYGSPVLIIGLLSLVIVPVGGCGRRGILAHLWIFGFVFEWLPLCYWAFQKIDAKNAIVRTLVFWSKNVTAMYFFQWLLFGWSILLFDVNKQSAIVAALIGSLVLIMTHFIVKNKKIEKIFAFI